MQTLDEYKERLFSAMWDNAPLLFPDMDFRRNGKKMESTCHLDGQKDRTNKKITSIHSDYAYAVYDVSRDESKNVIEWYMERKSLGFWEALETIAQVCRVDKFERTHESEQARQIQENRENALRVFTAALWGGSEQAQKVLDYLHSRNWTDQEIRIVKLGLITTNLKSQLPDEKFYFFKKKGDFSIGETHLLAIPFYTSSRLLGFKFREIGVKTNNKYVNSKGLKKSECLFGLPPKGEDCIIVESELDALHVKAKATIMNSTAHEILRDDRGNEEAKQMIALADRMQRIAATAGGRLSEDMIKDTKERGYTRFTLIFDNDKGGRDFTARTISALEQYNAEAWVAELPEGVKDIDEYLANHTLGELSQIVEEALPFYVWKLHQLSLSYWQRSQAETPTIKEEDDYLREVEKLINSPSLIERPLSRLRLKEYIKNNEQSLNFKWEDIEAWVEQGYNRQAATKRRADASSAAQKISQLMEDGKVDEALALMGETSRTLKALDQGEEFSKIFAPLSWGEYTELLRSIPQGLPTGFKIDGEELTLNAGITFVCASTGHGKTSFLNNLLLNEARRNRELGNGKSVAYFSLEIDKRRLIADLLNTYLNDPELHTERAQSPIFSIYSYFERGGARDAFRSEAKFKAFEEANSRFYSEYISSGAIKIVDRNYLIGELISALRYLLTISTPSAIFIDYAQLIYKEGQSRQRTEEIKEIVNELKNFANENGLPIVLAAQFNRQVDSPLSVLSKNIGEGGDFERIADTIIGLYNLEKKGLGASLGEADKKTLAKLLNALLRKRRDSASVNEKNIEPIPNRLYVKLLKRRYGRSDGEEILSWEGKTKYIKPNNPDALKTSPSQEPDGQADLLSSPRKDENSLSF